MIISKFKFNVNNTGVLAHESEVHDKVLDNNPNRIGI